MTTPRPAVHFRDISPASSQVHVTYTDGPAQDHVFSSLVPQDQWGQTQTYEAMGWTMVVLGGVLVLTLLIRQWLIKGKQ